MPLTVLIACLVSLGIGISKVVNSGQVRHMWQSCLRNAKLWCTDQCSPSAVHHVQAAAKAPDVRSHRVVPVVSAAEDNAAGVPSVDDLQHGPAFPAAVVLAHRQRHHAADCVQVSARQLLHFMSLLMPERSACWLAEASHSGFASTTCSRSAILRKLFISSPLHRLTSNSILSMVWQDCVCADHGMRHWRAGADLAAVPQALRLPWCCQRQSHIHAGVQPAPSRACA